MKLPHLINLEIAHDAKSAKRMRVLDPGLALPLNQQLRRIRGKPQPALTVILTATPIQSGHVELEVEIQTGVMHQIRVHLAHLGFPILGDPLYSKTPSERLWLHASTLKMGNITINAPNPENWPGIK
jgi:23S rRNA-/tRNA-specific pseudouridylate synthase